VDRVTGSVVGEVCHIKGERATAPRYDPEQDDHERHGFDNLILLCNVHHKIIDDNPESYTVERLLAMKENHETRQEGKEAVDDGSSETFTSVVVDNLVEHGSVIQATNVSGGQVAHTITNTNLAPPDDEPVRIDGKITLSAESGLMQTYGCPGIVLAVACRSRRPAKIRRAMLCLTCEGIMAGMQAGFGSDFGYTPPSEGTEELTIDLYPLQKPSTENGFVLQQDDVVRFFYPVLAGPVGLFLDRPASASSMKVEFFDESTHTVLQGEEVRGQLEGLVETARTVRCEARFPPVKLGVTVKSITPPDLTMAGRLNPNPISFGKQQGDTKKH